MADLIDYSQSDFIAWQAEREAMRMEIERLRAQTWADAKVIDGLRAENDEMQYRIRGLEK